MTAANRPSERRLFDVDPRAWVALLDSGETPRLPRSAPADAPTEIYDELVAERSRGQVA